MKSVRKQYGNPDSHPFFRFLLRHTVALLLGFIPVGLVNNETMSRKLLGITS